MSQILTHERLLKILRYEPETGCFYWLVCVYKPRLVGKKAGARRPDGYIQVAIDGVLHRAHRLAFFYMTGRWPAADIDHRDLVRSNNKWDNLREATSSQNKQNIGLKKNNTSGIKGVYWNAAAGKWAVEIIKDKTKHRLGFFDCKEDAGTAYARKAAELFGEFARLA